MKLNKTISLLAAVLMTASMFTACGSKDSKDSSDSSSAKDSVTESASEEETSEDS